MNEYGLWALPFVIILAAIVGLYDIVWKGREDRKLIKLLKEEASVAGDDPDEIFRNVVMKSIADSRRKQTERTKKQIEEQDKRMEELKRQEN